MWYGNWKNESRNWKKESRIRVGTLPTPITNIVTPTTNNSPYPYRTSHTTQLTVHILLLFTVCPPSSALCFFSLLKSLFAQRIAIAMVKIVPFGNYLSLYVSVVHLAYLPRGYTRFTS